jgi:hypothetical protein
VRYDVRMRVHVVLEESLVRRMDARIGAGRRSAFVASAIEHALDDVERWELLESAFGTIPDSGHEWDADPAEWVRAERRTDERRVG